MLAQDAYVAWTPSRLEDYVPHPSEVCEPVNLAASSQPALSYRMRAEVGNLSTLQVETICRAMQAFEARQAFLLGDATGVGKGRTIAGLVAEAVARDERTRVAWVSASTRLQTDAYSELAAVGLSEEERQECVCFASYSRLQATERSSSVAAWLGGGGRAILVLDESHMIRNTRNVSAKSIVGLIEAVRRVRSLDVLYSSATACSLPKHCEYMEGLGLFGCSESPFARFEDLTRAFRKHGPALMELMAIDMRARGVYVARQLSVKHVEIVNRVVELSASQTAVYDACGARLREAGVFRGSCQQSMFQRLLTGFKAPNAVALARHHVAAGSSVVVSILNTGESAASRHEKSSPALVGEDAFQRLDISVDGLPVNPLDLIVNELGEENVAEITGRRHRLVRRHGRFVRERVPPVAEQVRLFQEEAKHVAVISRAGGVGISLHDTTSNRPRVHIILEMPWSAEDLLQQMGRTHRSSSRTHPTYVLLTTDVPAEMRFASAVVAKLQSFGAMVKGDRQSCRFRFFDVPKWSTAERRSLALYLAVADATREGEDLPSMSRHAAASLCHAPTSRGYQSEASMKDKLTSVLRASEQLPHRTDLVAAAHVLFPRDVTPALCPRWTPVVHGRFPRAFRDRVFALLLCARSWEARHTLGVLVPDLLHAIIERIARPVTAEEARTVALRCRQHMLHDLAAQSMDNIFNRMFGMEVAVQRNLMAVAAMFAQPPRPPSSICFLKYVEDRNGSSARAVVAGVEPLRFDAVSRGVCIRVELELAVPETPPEGAAFWWHPRSKRVCWRDERSGELHFAEPSVAAPAVAASSMEMRAKGYAEATAANWEDARYKHEKLARRRMRKVPRFYKLVTEHAMRSWDSSLQRILRVPATPVCPKGLVGLLVSSHAEPR